MTTTLVKGQKVDVTKTNPGLSNVLVGLGWNAPQGMDLDASVFLLGANGKVIREADFIFYGNPTSSNGAIVHSGDSKQVGNQDNEQIQIDFSQIPDEIQKIAFTMTIYDAKVRRQTFASVQQGYLRIVDQQNYRDIYHFPLSSFTVENAIVVGELYRYNGEWKFNSIGAGFEGGLAALCGNFGVEVAEPSPTSPTPPPPPAQVNQPPVVITPTPQVSPSVPLTPPTPPLNLSKFELKKKGDVINLKKSNKKLGEILVNLNWKQGSRKSSFGFLGFGTKKGIDLDLGCFIEMKDGEKTAIQVLGEHFGSYHEYPFIQLDLVDDHTGSVQAGETIRINGNHASEFKKILVYAFIYQGVVNWAEVDGALTIKEVNNPEIVVRMDFHEKRKGICAIALIENVDNDTFSIKKVVQYFSGHREMDKAFHWGLRWKPGSK